MKGIMLMVLGLAASLAWGQSAPVDSAAEAKATIKAIWEAAQVYCQDHGEWPKDFKVLTDSGHYEERTFPPYLVIPAQIEKEWGFSLRYGGPPTRISAKSKTRTYKSEGGVRLPEYVDYDVAGGRWSGYGVSHYSMDTLNSEQRAELAEDAINAMRAIHEGALVYYDDKGSWPQTVEQLKAQSYIGVYRTPPGTEPNPPLKQDSPSVFTQWQFAFVDSPDIEIIAISTKDMPGGAGKGIEYDVARNAWRGYGIKE